LAQGKRLVEKNINPFKKVSFFSNSFMPTGAMQSGYTTEYLELATDGDYSFVQYWGGVAGAEAAIAEAINYAGALYINQLGIDIRWVFGNSWTYQDPYPEGHVNTLLDAFAQYWEANFPRQLVDYKRDSAHLFTNKSIFGGSGAGFIGTVCNIPSAAYSMSRYNTTFFAQKNLFAHEVGHTLGGTHPEELTPIPPGCGTSGESLMNGSVPSYANPLFCEFSRGQIRSLVDSTSCTNTPPRTF
ncbi:MAG: M12 family metallo-peptidase, partial [Acidobacteria bacterium]|nr:M12 family metallo-peptidase [Acidobacteriota bacterium]